MLKFIKIYNQYNNFVDQFPKMTTALAGSLDNLIGSENYCMKILIANGVWREIKPAVIPILQEKIPLYMQFYDDVLFTETTSPLVLLVLTGLSAYNMKNEIGLDLTTQDDQPDFKLFITNLKEGEAFKSINIISKLKKETELLNLLYKKPIIEIQNEIISVIKND